MRIFLTGATGFIGSAIIPELLQAGHTVLGLTRSDSGAAQLQKAGAEPYHGDLNQPESLQAGAASADAVIHCAFDHDFSNMLANCDKDRRNIESMAEVLAGSDRPLLITSGTLLGSNQPGDIATEDVANFDNPHPRKASEIAGQAALDRGVNVSVMRLPQVHDTLKQGLITYFIPQFRQTGVAAYIGEGQNCLSAAHVTDVARLYRLAIEAAVPGARYHAVAEQGVPLRAIAEALAQGLKIPTLSITPDQAPAYFGWMSMFANLDFSASSALTRQSLGWTPTGPTLLTDLGNMLY